MSKLRDNRVQQKLQAAKPAYSDQVNMITGHFVDGVFDNNPSNNAPAGFIWVTLADGRGETPALIGESMRDYQYTGGIECKTGINEYHQREAIKPTGNPTNAALNQQIVAAAQLSRPTFSQNVSGGRVLASPNGGLNIYVEADPQVGWSGGDIPVDSGDLPASADEWEWLVVYTPAYTGIPVTPVYLPTTPQTRPNMTSLPLDDARNLLLPTGAIRRGAVAVGYGETNLTNVQGRFVDLRRDFASETPRNNYDASGAPTVNDDETEGYAPLSVWRNGADIYDCTDATTGAAIWTQRGAGGATTASAVSYTPTSPLTGTNVQDALDEAAALIGAGGGSDSYILIQDQKTSGTFGGACTGGTWQTRDLTTLVVNEGSHCSISGNQFTLDAGTYEIDVRAPALNVGENNIRLQNITDSATVITGGNVSSATGSATVTAFLSFKFTITGSKTFEIQHYGVSANASVAAFGVAGSHGTEIYTEVEIRKVA